MRYLSWVLSLFPWVSTEGRAAIEAADAQITSDVDGLRADVAGLRADVEYARRGLTELDQHMQAAEARLDLCCPPAAPSGPSPSPSTVMAPTPAGYRWVVIPSDAGPQMGEIPVLRCERYTPVPAELSTGQVLTLLPETFTG